MDNNEHKKALLIMNALEHGWTIRKKNKTFVFTKKHCNKKKYFMKNYLEIFLSDKFEHSVASHS